MQVFRPTRLDSKIAYKLSLDDEINATNEWNNFSNGECTLPVNLCNRVWALIDLPGLLCMKSSSPDDDLHRNSEHTRIYYVERNLFRELPTARHGTTLPKKSPKKHNVIQSDHVQEDDVFQMLKSFIAWVNNWTSSTDNILDFAKIKARLEKSILEN